MCGIVAVLSWTEDLAVPAPVQIASQLRETTKNLSSFAETSALVELFTQSGKQLETLNAELLKLSGLRAVLNDSEGEISRETMILQKLLPEIDAFLDANEFSEDVYSATIRLKDAIWAVAHDRMTHATAVRAFCRDSRSISAVSAYSAIQIALSSLDFLEVRGRDSAGLQVSVQLPQLDVKNIEPQLLARNDLSYRSNAVRRSGNSLIFVYKSAATIGELGDNSRKLRAEIDADELLRWAVQHDGARASVLGHTRWASIGIISEANAHPQNSDGVQSSDGPYVTAALNGDIDNYSELAEAAELAIPPDITTDAKVIPMLVSGRMAQGSDSLTAFRETIASFEGSVAIAGQIASDPQKMYLALRGSGQGLNVGLAPGAFVVASEPYGLVEQTSRYIRLNGELGEENGTPGQIAVLDAAQAGLLTGIARYGIDGGELPVTEADVMNAEITTRDVDRGSYSHYLLKEISESPLSWRKTLRGKLSNRDGDFQVSLKPSTIPAELEDQLRSGKIRRIFTTGQGTAAIAAQAVAAVLSNALGTADPPVSIEALPATELSGFRLYADMKDCLVIPVSQSGTTNDTNRTVDLVRARGGWIVSIVNRRSSDLVAKSHGVLYTSDGRDIEMSVASTKAFYSQVAAGVILSSKLSEMIPGGSFDPTLLSALRDMPDAMQHVVELRPRIAQAARNHALTRRSWAVVGNGHNRVAANEIRIKLSELCYKAIPSDFTEDKKHIDLSAEPLILVCAAGLTGSTADDVSKEVKIYKAHKAAPIVFATDGNDRFEAASELISFPSVHPQLDFVLSTMAGHIFGFEAALALDETARPLRMARGILEGAIVDGFIPDDVFTDVQGELEAQATEFYTTLRAGQYDGALDASIAAELSTLLRFGAGWSSLDSFETEFGRSESPSALVIELIDCLTKAIDALTRPIDAIRHQAKTVTVGISRSDDLLLRAPLVQEILEMGMERDRLSYRTLRTLVELAPAISHIDGYTRYRIEGDPDDGTATIAVVDKGGIATQLQSRADADPRLSGTKRRVASEREVTVAVGRRDNRTVVIIPEVKGTQPTGLTLLHVRFAEQLPVETISKVLRGYRNRLAAIQDAVTETESQFDTAKLSRFTTVELLTQPVYVIADTWKTR